MGNHPVITDYPNFILDTANISQPKLCTSFTLLKCTKNLTLSVCCLA